MTENKTVKYCIPQQGIYMYARMRDGKMGMIVLQYGPRTDRVG